MANDKSDVDFLFEVGTLRHVKRAWAQFSGEDFANVAEHSFRVIWIAMLIANAENADTDKVLKMALVHDLAETRTGDLNYVNKEYVQSLEGAAVTDALASTSLSRDMQAVWLEFKNRSTLEAKIVKDADNLDCDLELQELEAKGSSLPKLLRETRERVFEQLHTESARLMFTRIRQSSCHDWHLNGRNRLNSGDWKRLLGEAS